jgi:hypothetical protein
MRITNDELFGYCKEYSENKESFSCKELDIYFDPKTRLSRAEFELSPVTTFLESHTDEFLFNQGFFLLTGINGAQQACFAGLKLIAFASESGLLAAQFFLTFGFKHGDLHIKPDHLVSLGWKNRMIQEHGIEAVNDFGKKLWSIEQDDEIVARFAI